MKYTPVNDEAYQQAEEDNHKLKEALKKSKVAGGVSVVALDDDDEITYDKLVRFIEQNHPTKVVEAKEGEENTKSRQESFSIFEDVGTLKVVKCCNERISPMAIELGIGPTLFLLSTKAMAWFFFFLTIINLPLFYFYFNGTMVDQNSQGGSPKFDDNFVKLSLGNIGQSSYACGEANLALVNNDINDKDSEESNRNSKITLRCSGFAKLGMMRKFGLI